AAPMAMRRAALLSQRATARITFSDVSWRKLWTVRNRRFITCVYDLEARPSPALFFYTNPMTLQELEQALEKAKADLATWQARGVLLNECSHTWMDGMTQRSDAILAAERALSAARGEEYAVVWTEG